MTTPTVLAECYNLRQGDLVSVPQICEAAWRDDRSPDTAAVISQTCDVVQSGRTRITLAPAKTATEEEVRDAAKGRKPLLVPVLTTSGTRYLVDLEHPISVLKSNVEGELILDRFHADTSSTEAGALATRIGRAYSRFPFPDELYPFFSRLRAKAQKAAGSKGAFGFSIDQLLDIRVSSDQWASEGRNLRVYLVANGDVLIPLEDADPAWVWGPERVNGYKPVDALETLNLQRAAELLKANTGRDGTTQLRLWGRFAVALAEELLAPDGREVARCEVEVLSDLELTYRAFSESESLDLEVLSDGSVS